MKRSDGTPRIGLHATRATGRGRGDGASSGVNQIGPARQGRAGQQNPADLWSRVRPGPQANLRDHDHLFGLRAPVALRDLELDPLSLFEGAVAIRLDRGEVDENVLATVDGDKAVSLVRVEPFDGALSHSKQLPNIRSGLEPRPCHRGTRRSRTDEKG